MEVTMEETTRAAIVAQLGLIAEQIAVDSVWAVRQVETVAEAGLHDWYCAERGEVPGRGSLAAAGRAARGPFASDSDRAFHAHALAANERLAEAAVHMERLAVRDPRADYFQFLASVYERAGRLPEALGAARRGLDANPGSAQLEADRQRIVVALQRARLRSAPAALALWEERGGGAMAALALGLHLCAGALRRRFASA